MKERKMNIIEKLENISARIISVEERIAKLEYEHKLIKSGKKGVKNE